MMMVFKCLSPSPGRGTQDYSYKRQIFIDTIATAVTSSVYRKHIGFKLIWKYFLNIITREVYFVIYYLNEYVTIDQYC